MVIELLSPSREGDDGGDKRTDFQSLASLEAYVVVAQEERRVRVYRRAESGAWGAPPELYVDGQSFALPTLARPIAVAEVYERILSADGRSLLV